MSDFELFFLLASTGSTLVVHLFALWAIQKL